MSARAAWRLERFGFPDVVEYAGGKQDWLAAGLELETEHGTQVAPIAAVARPDWPTASLDERAGTVLERLDDDQAFAVVVNDEQVVLGKLLRRVATDHPDATVEDVLLEGPTTVRGSGDPHGLAQRMERAGTSSVLVTTKEGRLLGVVVIDDLQAALDHDH